MLNDRLKERSFEFISSGYKYTGYFIFFFSLIITLNIYLKIGFSSVSIKLTLFLIGIIFATSIPAIFPLKKPFTHSTSKRAFSYMLLAVFSWFALFSALLFAEYKTNSIVDATEGIQSITNLLMLVFIITFFPITRLCYSAVLLVATYSLSAKLIFLPEELVSSISNFIIYIFLLGIGQSRLRHWFVSSIEKEEKIE